MKIGFSNKLNKSHIWLCKPPNIPVIWTTQVLGHIFKTGLPTRAAISDVVQAVQAECIMLNKGLFINDAIEILKNILIGTEAHSFKKKNSLRAFNIAKN